jgi:hypothetical protein
MHVEALQQIIDRSGVIAGRPAGQDSGARS